MQALIPFDWTDHGDYWSGARAAGFRYSVRRNKLGCWWEVHGQSGKEGGGKCANIDDGKAQCWQDYQRRIAELFQQEWAG